MRAGREPRFSPGQRRGRMATRAGGTAGGAGHGPDEVREEGAGAHWTERVRARARELGFTDADVARRLDVSTTRYNNYMGRAREPDLMLFARICRVLDTTPDRVLAFEAEPRGDTPGGRELARATARLRALPRSAIPLACALLDALADNMGDSSPQATDAGKGAA